MNEALRVLLVAACPFPCARGTPRRVLGHAEALLAGGVRVTVATYHLAESPPPPGLEVVRIPRVPTYRRLRAGPTSQKLLVLDPLLFALALRRARRARPDVVHGHHVEGGLVARAVGARLGIPFFYDLHSPLSAELARARLPLRGRVLDAARALDVSLARASARVTTITEAMRRSLLDLAAGAVSADRVSVVPSPLDRLPFEDRERDPGARERGLRIVYAGSLAPVQRLDLLGAVFDRVLDARPDAELVIVSEDEPAPLRAQWPGALSHPRVRVIRPARLETVFAVLSRADVAVSLRTAPGGFPRKLLNYARTALPVVCFERGAETLEHGSSGWVVPDEDVEAAARGLVRLLDDRALRRRIGRAAREAVWARYDVAAVGARLAALYRTAVR